MITATEISRRFWNLPQKGDEEAERESIYIDDLILKTHTERDILTRLDGVRTVFDAGAGSGRFSIPLARMGLKVTHFDISQPMIDKARETAEREGVDSNIEFVLGSLEDDLAQYRKGQFDMVISTDAPICYTYPRQEEVIGNLVRIASRRLILSVHCRMGWIPYHFNPAQKAQYILDLNTGDGFARWTLDHAAKLVPDFKPDMKRVRDNFLTGLMEKPEETAAAYERGETPWPVAYGFMPDELLSILQRFGIKDVKLAGPGALSRSIPREVLVNIMGDESLKREFLDFCYEYDSQSWCAGMGKDNLVVCVEK